MQAQQNNPHPEKIEPLPELGDYPRRKNSESLKEDRELQRRKQAETNIE